MSSVINSLLTEKMITIIDSLPDDWMHAIRIAAKPLLSENIIEEKYIDKMINNVIEFGPYINFVEKFAMPHARPSDGSKERGISLLITKESVNLLEDKDRPINIFLCISSINNDEHLDILAELSEYLSQESFIDDLIRCNNSEEVINLFKKGGET